jgi:hypothetical protein
VSTVRAMPLHSDGGILGPGDAPRCSQHCWTRFRTHFAERTCCVCGVPRAAALFMRPTAPSPAWPARQSARTDAARHGGEAESPELAALAFDDHTRAPRSFEFLRENDLHDARLFTYDNVRTLKDADPAPNGCHANLSEDELQARDEEEIALILSDPAVAALIYEIDHPAVHAAPSDHSKELQAGPAADEREQPPRPRAPHDLLDRAFMRGGR